jgi:hypothetical protein
MDKKLKVWWIPQVPGKPFEVFVSPVEEGVRIMDVLADYDKFQFENRITPDYCNVGGLMEYDEEGEWVDWCDDETGEDDPHAYLEEKRNGEKNR